MMQPIMYIVNTGNFDHADTVEYEELAHTPCTSIYSLFSAYYVLFILSTTNNNYTLGQVIS
ncbi:hypothetical protein BH18THE2_BH18THE2_09190 [soil metagenome]